MGESVHTMPGAPQKQILLDILLADRKRFVEVAQHIVRCRARAEDVVQEAALRIWQNPPVPELHTPRGYIRRLICNLAIDIVRQVGFECRLFASIEAAGEAASPCTCPHERLEACQSLKAVMAALDAAPTRIRHAVLAHRVDGVAQKTIASESGVSPALVNVMIRDATALCHKALVDESRSTSASRAA